MEKELPSCVLRNWLAKDDVALQRYANNRKVWLNLRDRFPHPYTMDDAHNFLRHVLNHDPKTTFAIATATEAIGGIGLQLGSDVHRKTAELGYWLAEPFWGQGIMSAMVSQFTRLSFTRFDLNRIYAEPFATNLASARVLEKAGYSREGLMRSHVLKDGHRLDSLLYACVPEDFSKIDGIARE